MDDQMFGETAGVANDEVGEDGLSVQRLETLDVAALSRR